jgi:precorrin-6A/cobalt-precorrin-6A reductase
VPTPTVLILGGTAEARALAVSLNDAGVPVVSSLAGRVRDPTRPVGEVRIGGFGGPGGLAEYLRERRIRAVVDATHPFAMGMSASAAAACDRTGVRLLRLARPGWGDHPLAGTWRWVDDTAAAAAAAAGHRVLLTTGRRTLGDFIDMAATFVLVRLVDPVSGPLPGGWSVVTSRGPYTLPGEVALMRDHRIEVLVTKDSGGAMTEPKLVAAQRLGVKVVILRRPPAEPGVPAVDGVPDAAAWVQDVAGR